jgi:hypothetical protein
MVAQRRERIATVATVILQEGVAAGEFSADLDVVSTARALGALLDGVVLECISSGVPPTRADVERRATLLIGPSIEQRPRMEDRSDPPDPTTRRSHGGTPSGGVRCGPT